jgi:carboxyl-terminal processing protease
MAKQVSHKLKIAGWVAIGVVAGALTTVQLQAVARGALAPLPLEELQQLAAVFGMVKSDYVEPVDEKKLISDAISGMVASLDPHSQYFDKKSFKEFREGTSRPLRGRGHRNHDGGRPGQGRVADRRIPPHSAPASRPAT